LNFDQSGPANTTLAVLRRALRLPAQLDAEKAEAKIENGVLTLRIPKAESARPRVIKVAAK
jgi:HSP20 family protein